VVSDVIRSEVYRISLTKSLPIYLLVAFGIAYPIEIKAAEIMVSSTGAGMLIAEFMLAGAMYAPAVAAFVALLSNGLKLKDCITFLGIIKPGFRWVGYSLAITYAILGVCLGLLTIAYGSATYVTSALELVGSHYFPMGIAGISLLLAVLALVAAAGLTINAVFALGEEIGWRGFLYSTLYRRLGYIASGFIIGFIWGLWHAPLIALLNYDFTMPAYYSPAPPLHILLFCLFTTALNFIMLRVRELSGSVVATAFIHGTFNVIGGIGLLASMMLPEYMRFPGGLIGTASAAIVAVCLNIAVYVRRKALQAR